MPIYSVHLFCAACGRPHPLTLGIQTKDEISSAQSVGDVYDGREMPSEITTIKGNSTYCPVSGEKITQGDHFDIFLVRND
jgi:hypothetical protein